MVDMDGIEAAGHVGVKASLMAKGTTMDLDELLDRSAPPTAPRSATLRQELQRMVASSEAVARPRPHVFKVGLVSAMAAGVLGVGTAGAMATGILPTPTIPWSTDAGSSCEMQFTASAAGSDGQPLSKPYTQAEKQRAVTEANRFLAAIDYSSINEADAIREWTKAEDAAIAGVEPAERQRPLTGDDLAITAVGRVVWNQLAADLTAHGIPTETVVFAQAWRCE